MIRLSNCTATLSEDEQRFAVEKNFPMFSRPATHEQFLSDLAGERVLAGTGRGYS